MKKLVQIFICIISFSICDAQTTIKTDSSSRITGDEFILINSQKVITNEMIFYPPYEFKKNKSPLFLVNGKKVYTIAFYNRDEFKKITVLQPKEGSIKFGEKGKNGVVIVDLKDEVKGPEIEVLSNKLYYKCAIEGKLIDTSKEYYDKNGGKNCSILDLRDTSKTPALYLDFYNEIKIKNLGVGWDMATVFVIGAMISGTRQKRLVVVKKEGLVKITVSTRASNNKSKQTEIIFRVLALPTVKS